MSSTEVEEEEEDDEDDEEEQQPMDMYALVQEALPKVGKGIVHRVCRVIQAAGIMVPSDLAYLKEEDFKGVLKLVHRRRLVHHLHRRCE